MSYVPNPRGTLLIPSGPGHHLFVVMTKKCSSGCHLILNITSIKAGKFHDPACVFAGGEHPLITQPCYVYYKMADQKNAQSVTKFVDSKFYVDKTEIDQAHFDKICAGIFTSKFSSPWVKKYFTDNRP
jgi:hypothetical protein